MFFNKKFKKIFFKTIVIKVLFLILISCDNNQESKEESDLQINDINNDNPISEENDNGVYKKTITIELDNVLVTPKQNEIITSFEDPLPYNIRIKNTSIEAHVFINEDAFSSAHTTIYFNGGLLSSNSIETHKNIYFFNDRGDIRKYEHLGLNEIKIRSMFWSTTWKKLIINFEYSFLDYENNRILKISNLVHKNNILQFNIDYDDQWIAATECEILGKFNDYLPSGANINTFIASTRILNSDNAHVNVPVEFYVNQTLISQISIPPGETTQVFSIYDDINDYLYGDYNYIKICSNFYDVNVKYGDLKINY